MGDVPELPPLEEILKAYNKDTEQAPQSPQVTSAQTPSVRPRPVRQSNSNTGNDNQLVALAVGTFATLAIIYFSFASCSMLGPGSQNSMQERPVKPGDYRKSGERLKPGDYSVTY